MGLQLHTPEAVHGLVLPYLSGECWLVLHVILQLRSSNTFILVVLQTRTLLVNKSHWLLLVHGCGACCQLLCFFCSMVNWLYTR